MRNSIVYSATLYTELHFMVHSELYTVQNCIQSCIQYPTLYSAEVHTEQSNW